MKPDTCHCGEKDVRVLASRVSGSARRRQYHCKVCDAWFATIELRVPAQTDMAVFQAKVRNLLLKGERNGAKRKAEIQSSQALGSGNEVSVE